MKSEENELFCIEGEQCRTCLKTEHGTYRIFGSCAYRKGFFMVSWKDKSNNTIFINKFVRSE